MMRKFIFDFKLLAAILMFMPGIDLFSSTSDTVLKADLNYDGKEEVIKFVTDEAKPGFILKVNNSEETDVFEYGYYRSIDIIDMDRNDNLKEIVVKGIGDSDNLEMFFYQFIDGKIISCGIIKGYNGYETKGDKELTVSGWMGFWAIEHEYKFDSQNKSLTHIQKEFYDVNIECEVKNPFPVLTDRYDQSPVSSLLKTGTKIKLVKADITPKCRMTDGYEDEDNCDWYLIRTSEGAEGWCRLKDFRDNVDGLIWAG